MQTYEDSMLRKTILSAAMLLARNGVAENDGSNGMAFTMKVDGVNQSNYQALIVKEADDGHDFFSILAFQGEFGSQDDLPSVWLSVNANAEGTYAIQRRLNFDGAWALYNDAEGTGFNFFSGDPKRNKGFVSTCGAITISSIDTECRRISGKFQFNASNSGGKTKTISEGIFSNLSYFEQA
ncbi:MAG TPA: DUF6252 family protein [Anseongella sp.]